MPSTWWGGKYPYEFRDADVIKRTTFSRHESNLEEAYSLAIFWTAFDIHLSEDPRAAADAVPMLPIYECRVDAMSSMILASYGRYKPAISLLRSILELSFLSVYLKYRPRHDTQAENGDLRWGNIRDFVLSRPRSRAYVSDFKSKNMKRLSSWLEDTEVKRLYRSLSFAVHSRIDTWDVDSDEFGEGPAYKYSKFHYWFRSFKRVHRLAFLLLLIHFPGVVRFYRAPFFGDIEMPDDWLGVLRPAQIRYLQAVS